MSENSRAEFAGDVDPSAAWDALTGKPQSFLVDVRTTAEWAFVGSPDLSDLGKTLWRIEWKTYPTMAPNPAFFADLAKAVQGSGAEDVYFLCRSGQRSREAAQLGVLAPEVRALGQAFTFYNVAEGFEGVVDPETGHRGVVDGWKARRLPWRQT